MKLFKRIFGDNGLGSKSKKDLIKIVEDLQRKLEKQEQSNQDKLVQANEQLEQMCWNNNILSLSLQELDETDPFYQLYQTIKLLHSNYNEHQIELNDLSKKLENKVSQKIQDLNDHLSALNETENILKEQNMELQKLNEELDKFVYSASHDLRAPIASIQGLINIALSEDSKELIKEYLKLMSSSANKLDGLIRDIINYSWNSRIELVPEKIDFNEIIEEIYDNFSYMQEYQKVNKLLDIQQDSLFYTDKSRFKIILNNVVGNAIKFCDTYKVDPTVSIKIRSDFEKAIIKISDNGEGIPLEHQKDIFDMFFKANPHKSGSGLGLYIAKEALAKLNGTVEVNSSLGEYTEFVIVIPNLLNKVIINEPQTWQSMN